MMQSIGNDAYKGNIILKLDMENASNRIEWSFLETLLDSFGFSTRFTTFVHGYISSNTFTVLFQVAIMGFFLSSMSLRQGDPLSPYLFILAVEVLSRGIRRKLSEKRIDCFYTPRVCTLVTHLLFADDTLLFLNGKLTRIRRIVDFLKRYCKTLGEKLNKGKI